MVLFKSNRPLDRAENIKAVFDAYDGEKEFVHANPYMPQPDYSDGKYKLLVTDELVKTSPEKCIFIGHGMGAFKTYGADQPQGYFRQEDGKNIDYCIASSRHMIPIVAKQCGVSETQVLPLGMPRTDRYFTEMYKYDKRTYVYLPTFRRKCEWKYVGIDWDYIDSHLSDDEQLIVKAHMVVNERILSKKYKHIHEASKDEVTTPYLMASDVVITDYSSVIFDAFVCRKPVILFEKDYEVYEKGRGIYYKYPDDYSNLHCRTEAELLELLRNAKWDSYFENRKEFFTEYCDGHSTERVIKLIKEVL